jgi:ketosteroid isomerase-like protein
MTRVARLVLVVWMASGGSAAAQSAMADMAAVNKALADLMGAYARRDMNAIAQLMASDVVAFGSNYTAAGVEDFRRKGAPALAMVRGARPASKQDVAMSGNIAYVAFLVDTDRQPPGGGAITSTRVRWTLIFERRNSRWVITHFHLSTDPNLRN